MTKDDVIARLRAREPELRVDAVKRCLSRITGAVIQIGEAEAAMTMPDIPFHLIRGMGNRLRHDDKGIDTRAVYETVHDELPKLTAAAVQALEHYAR